MINTPLGNVTLLRIYQRVKWVKESLWSGGHSFCRSTTFIWKASSIPVHYTVSSKLYEIYNYILSISIVWTCCLLDVSFKYSALGPYLIKTSISIANLRNIYSLSRIKLIEHNLSPRIVSTDGNLLWTSICCIESIIVRVGAHPAVVREFGSNLLIIAKERRSVILIIGAVCFYYLVVYTIYAVVVSIE